jgi:hypothetical protein
MALLKSLKLPGCPHCKVDIPTTCVCGPAAVRCLLVTERGQNALGVFIAEHPVQIPAGAFHAPPLVFDGKAFASPGMKDTGKR